MTSQSRLTDVELALLEAHALLAQQRWDIHDHIFLEGEHVCVLVDPYPSAEANCFNVPVTILMLQGRADAVVQAPLVLASSARSLYYGRLNPRGQVMFRGLPAGEYAVDLVLDSARFEDVLGQLPEQARRSLHVTSVPLRLDAPNSTGTGSTFRTADGALAVTARVAEVGDLVVDLVSTDPAWEGRLAAIAWRPAPSAGAAAPAWQLLLAILSRDKETSTCATTVTLGRVAFPCDVLMPVHPLPDEILSADLSAVVEASLAQALPASSLQAWRQRIEHTPTLPAQMRQVVDTAWQRTAAAGRLWKTEAARLYRLASEVVVQLGAATASFGRLPVSLTPQLMPAAALRAGGAAATGTIELLELPHAEGNLMLKLSLGPISNSLGALIVTVASVDPSGPIRQAKVSLRDADGRLLESVPTDEDGLALFQALDAGAYQIHVQHRDITWQVPLIFEASRDT